MILQNAVVSPFGTNCFVIGCEETLEGAVIDPGDDADQIIEIAKAEGLSIGKIILTHGHIDHAGAAGAVKEATGASVYMHADDLFLLEHGPVMAAQFGWFVSGLPAPDKTLSDGDEIEIGRIKLKVLHTPGHSPGCISLSAGGIVFVGDLIFAGSIGRTDLGGGSHATLLRSVREKIFPLPDSTKLYPGHGPATTVGREKKHNPFFN